MIITEEGHTKDDKTKGKMCSPILKSLFTRNSCTSPFAFNTSLDCCSILLFGFVGDILGQRDSFII